MTGMGGFSLNRREFLASALVTPAAWAARRQRPNIIFIYTDDLGFADLSCCGGKFVETTNLDRLAGEGVHFTKFYTASPICSPSRVGVSTGMFPSRWSINNYLHTREANRKTDSVDWLDPKAPTLARTLQNAGYSTGHFGKWHMGGGRDVQDAPEPREYGFDESLTQFEGMGPRIDPEMPRNQITATFINRALQFIRKNKEKPFYVNLWPMDVHNPFVPDPATYVRTTDQQKQRQDFCLVLKEYDRQMGRFLSEISALGLDENTLVLFTGDNGPNPALNGERTGGLRGAKASLYEGGIREPLFARWKGVIPSGRRDDTTVLTGVDFLPTLAQIAQVPLPAGAALDGEDLSHAILRKPQVRHKAVFWEYCRNVAYPAEPTSNKSPNLAIRDGRWKFLVHADGNHSELYNLDADPNETTDLAEQEQAMAQRLKQRLLAWRRSLPGPVKGSS
jgi:arylsulfatase A-like enzyme